MNLDVNEALGMLIPLVAVVLGIALAIVAIVTKHRRQMQELDHRHKERMAAIDKGLDLPPDPLVEQAAVAERLTARRRPGSNYLLRGLIWLGVGIALVGSNSILGSDNRAFAWIAVAVGVAYLIYYAFEGRWEGPPPGGPPNQ
ncbi:MAG: hypothetical protein JSR66_02485 [Proteobacteria bacterium]|nr:hypothetical protein [Pseudomonadota bacterium]